MIVREKLREWWRQFLAEMRPPRLERHGAISTQVIVSRGSFIGGKRKAAESGGGVVIAAELRKA